MVDIQAPQYQIPEQKSGYNAVRIDINNPQVTPGSVQQAPVVYSATPVAAVNSTPPAPAETAQKLSYYA